jgi:hypothetical protein
MNWIRRLLKWLFPCDRPVCASGCICGKGETQITYPSAPAQPTTAESIDAWVKAMPTVFAEQQRQAPMEAQQQLDLLNQYGVPLGLATQNIDKALNPITSG